MTNENIQPTGMVHSAANLLELARAAYVDIPQEMGELGAGSRNAIVAIVFCAITLEGFINELVATARLPVQDQPEAVKSFAELGMEFDTLRASTEGKFHLARIVFTGQAWDRGAFPYQDFQLLIDLRDALVHHKPELWEGRFRPHRVLEKLRSKNITAITEWEQPLSTMVSTRAAARWACNTAISMIQATLDVVPASHMKRTTQLIWKNVLGPL